MKRGFYIPPSKRRKRRGKMLVFLAFLMLFCFFLVVFDRRIYPIVKDFATAQAQILSNNAINTAVEAHLRESGIKYDDLIVLSRAEDGAVTSAQANTTAVNLIKTGVVKAASERVSALDETTVNIPIGSLTRSAYLAGRGPTIPIKLKIAANVFAEFESEFSDAGINQTLHKINLKVRAKVIIMLPISRASSEFESDYLIGQTVIVGKVPDAFTQVVDADDEMDGTIMDFGAELN